METVSTRVDPISGKQVIIYSGEGKPAQTTPAVLPETIVPCPFCEMGHQHKQGTSSVWSSGSPRPIIHSLEEVFVVPNKWSESGTPPQGFSELVLHPEHICWAHEFTSQQWKNLWTAAFTRIEAQKKFSSNSHMGVNVGKGAGGSIDHFHIHVLGTKKVNSVLARINETTLEEDLNLAKIHALILSKETDATSYVPYAPIFKAEIRIQAKTQPALIETLFNVMQTVKKSGVLWAYNILVHPKHLFVQVCFRPKPFGALEIMSDAFSTSVFPNKFLSQLKGN